MTQMMIKSPSGAYVTTAKSIVGYTPDFQRYYRPEMWPSDNGSLFTFAAFLRVPDQSTFLSNRMLLTSLDNFVTLFIRDWQNFTDLGGNTNRFLSYIRDQLDGWAAFQLGEGVHGIDSGDWFAYMFSIDYSDVSPVINFWVHKKGDAAGTDISGGVELDNDPGPIVFPWDDTSVVTSVGMHPDQLTNQGNYDICEIYITNEAVDWSDEANRLKFVDTEGKPVGLGADGSKLTGTKPKHHAADGDLTNNTGSESDWSEFGTILDAGTSPSD